MVSWNFTKSAEAVCKFFLKKLLGKLILGDIDLNPLRNGTVQLSDLALNVDFINQKFGETAILVVKEGSIGSLTVKLRTFEIEVEELEIVLAPSRKISFQVPSTSGQDGNSYPSHGFMTPEQMVEDTITTGIHEGVKTIAKMVKSLLTNLHVKIKKLIIALEPFSEEPKEKGQFKTLVLRFDEVECVFGISEDDNHDRERTVDGFLGLSRLTNFLKIEGAVLEFLNGNESTLSESYSRSCSLNAITPIITGEKGGFSGTVNLSIPWENGSLDIRKLDADVYIDPLELRLQPSSLKNFMQFANVFEELEKDQKSFTDSKTIESDAEQKHVETSVKARITKIVILISFVDENLGYIKVAEGRHIEAVLRTNCDNGCDWELECSESHIVLETCHDSTSLLTHLFAQIQQIFAPDVEESILHLQESCNSTSYCETYRVNLMDEISQGAFHINEFVPLSDDNGAEFIDGYFLSNMHPNEKTEILKNKSGWYGNSMLKIAEDHVLVKSSSKQGCRKVKGRVVLKNVDVRWTLCSGSDWQCTTGISTRNKDVALEFVLSKMGFQYDVFPDGETCVSKLSLSVQDFSLNDVSNGAPWIQVLGCYESKDHPRESHSRALKLELESIRPNLSIPLEEYRLKIGVLPMRLHLHQIQLDFLISFFGGTSSYPDHLQDIVELDMPHNLGSHSIREEALLPFFQKVSMSPVVIRVDYIPSHVDLPALRHGKYVELVNLFQWKGVELQLKHVEAVGVYGWSSVCETIISEWLEDLSQNQVHKVLKGLPPIRSLLAIGSSAAKLVSLPVKNYKKDGRLAKGMQRGTIAFLRSVSLEAIGLGECLAAGVHSILLQAEDIISTTPPTSVLRGNPYGRFSQPKDARQGIQQVSRTFTSF